MKSTIAVSAAQRFLALLALSQQCFCYYYIYPPEVELLPNETEVSFNESGACLLPHYKPQPDCRSWFLARELYYNDTLPDLFIESVLKLEADYRCTIPRICRWLDSTDAVPIQPNQLLPTHYKEFCLPQYKHVLAAFLARHFYAFNHFRSYLALENPADVPNILSFVVAYALPLQISAMLFGIHVMNRALAKSDSHILVYHKTLIAADLMLCIVAFLKTTRLMSLLILPACFVSLRVAAYYDNYMFDQMGFTTTVIEFTYSFTTMLQAALAMDRALAVFCPMFYARAITRKRAIAIVLACVVINTGICAVISATHAFEIIGNGFFSANDFVLRRYVTLATLFIIYYVVQLCCCTALALKVWWRKRFLAAPIIIGPAPSMLPSCLLLGTCGISLAGCILEIMYCFVFLEFYECQRHKLGTERRPVKDLTYDFLITYENYRHCILSLLSSCGVCVHCVVSTSYRTAAADAILALLHIKRNKAKPPLLQRSSRRVFPVHLLPALMVPQIAVIRPLAAQEPVEDREVSAGCDTSETDCGLAPVE